MQSRPSLAGLAARALGSILLLGAVLGAGVVLSTWKRGALAAAETAAASQPEHVETVAVALVRTDEHRGATTAIGTVRSLRWVTLQNELAGTIRSIAVASGDVVEEGAVLVALDVTVEEAELAAAQAGARLADSMFGRMERASESNGASAADVDRARAQVDIAHAEVARLRGVIERKLVRAPFAGRVGLIDVHPGQYLDAGTAITTLQGSDRAVHVDFRVPQDIGAALESGGVVEIRAGRVQCQGRVVAREARVDPSTRNVSLRALVEDGSNLPAPGGSVRVRVPVGDARPVALVPVSALRKGPQGEHVFVIGEAEDGALRAAQRRVVSGALLGDEVVIVEGLSAGERIAASGSFKLFHGVRVAPMEAAAAGSALQQ